MNNPVVVSETKQEFMGEMYYLCGNYFQKKGRRLHVAVWVSNFGDVPPKFHVHHRDGDRKNNNISNLVLLPAYIHLSLHSSTDESKARSRESIKKAIAAAPAWHRSNEGAEWHRENGIKCYAAREEVEKVCSHCGSVFKTKDLAHSGNVFCHQNCKASDRRARIKASGHKVLGYKGHVPTWEELGGKK